MACSGCIDVLIFDVCVGTKGGTIMPTLPRIPFNLFVSYARVGYRAIRDRTLCMCTRARAQYSCIVSYARVGVLCTVACTDLDYPSHASDRTARACHRDPES